MTDNDDSAPPSKPRAFGDGYRQHRGERPLAVDRATGWRSNIGFGAHIPPTDPEVPSAKRRGAIRRQRSLVGLSFVVMGLLSITLVLLYRAGTRVGVRDDDGMPLVGDNGVAASPVGVVRDGALTGIAPPPPLQSGAEIGKDTGVSNDNAPAGSASSLPKTQPPALDIIRTPSF